jgi:acyl-CoA dehydrogenase
MNNDLSLPPLADIGFALNTAAALLPALEQGCSAISPWMTSMRCWPRPAAWPAKSSRRSIGSATAFGTHLQGRRRHHRARLEGGLRRLAKGRLERPCAPAEWGGQGLPQVDQRRLHRDVERGSMAFGVGPMLTMGGDRRAQRPRQRRAQARVSGETRDRRMDRHDAAHRAAGRLRRRRAAHRAERAGDGSYRIKGQKIFITYGEHDLTDNIIHFVLARLPDAPPGTRGISLFLVPKFLLNADGSPGKRNDVRAIRSSTSSAFTARRPAP